ncbi:DUF3800 domain-containing protein [Thermosynechococcus sp. QS41]|uniref:DUF3800 domain-containing protein n=1 Tax=Thermosynechococcus sp. QS41 TaxID=3074101 RepID=UPI0028775F20|nr:DUF3800 domain-containing protein [Thermosynechococcus sp. QS41]WNC60570.1 DUF3800 domain-containing protein [Thermosynechococcus sp. QS41]
MYLIFVDECGYVKKWDSDISIQEQPFYILSAVAIPTTRIDGVYARIRKDIKNLNLPHTYADRLGHGEEIKAKSVDRGETQWGKAPDLRKRVIDAYLNHEEVTYFLVCVHKFRHKEKYSSPEDPSRLASRFLFERFQGFLEDQDAQGLVLVDKNKREEEQQQEHLGQLLTEGSGGIGFSEFYGTFYEWKVDFKNILEVHFGDSRYSLGLQIADFVARYAYSWRKNDAASSYPGWDLIEPRLYRYPSYQGWGLKEFP